MDAEGRLVAVRERLLPPGADTRRFLDFLQSLLGSLAEGRGAELTALGAGSCGVIRDGVILYSPNTPWKRLALAEALTARFQVPVAVMNDADAFALGVFHYEFAGEFPGLCALTLGSGLGGSLVDARGPLLGMRGISPEIGHMKVRAGGARCGCGDRGCLEAYVSKQALLDGYRRCGGGGEAMSPYDIYQAFRRGDEAAARAYAAYGRYLGVGMASLFNLFGPPAFVLGGGISRAASAFLPAAREALARGVLPGLGPVPRVLVSRWRSRASLLGAAHQARGIADSVLE